MTHHPAEAPLRRTLSLADLLPRPDRCSVLAPRAAEALARHVLRTGLVPALIVRPHPRRRGRFEIIDGHNRAEVLRRLGRRTARCEVWRVDDETAEVLAACLNHLRGRADAAARARQLRRLVRRHGEPAAAAMLGLTPRALRQQTDPPGGRLGARGPVAPGAPPLDLRPVVFHLTAEQSQLLAQTLGRFGAATRGRGEALAAALRAGQGAAPDRRAAPAPNEPNCGARAGGSEGQAARRGRGRRSRHAPSGR